MKQNKYRAPDTSHTGRPIYQLHQITDWPIPNKWHKTCYRETHHFPLCGSAVQLGWYRQDVRDKKAPKKWRKKILGKNMVPTNCKNGVKTSVVVFTFATLRISNLIYTASSTNALHAKHAKCFFLKVICVFIVAFCLAYRTHCVFPNSQSRILKFLHLTHQYIFSHNQIILFCVWLKRTFVIATLVHTSL